MKKAGLTILVTIMIFSGILTKVAEATPILDVIGGQLHGAKNVDVGGILYDVEFKEGRCVDLFTPCAIGGGPFLPFPNQGLATLASQTLLDTVFLDGVLGDFDSANTLTNGCTGLGASVWCWVMTPYIGFFGSNPVVGFAYAANRPTGIFDDFVSVNSRSRFSNTINNTVWAVWSTASGAASSPSPAPASPAPVPEPGTIILLGSGLIGLVGYNYKRNKKKI